LHGAAAKRGVPALRAVLAQLQAAQLTRGRLTIEGVRAPCLAGWSVRD